MIPIIVITVGVVMIVVELVKPARKWPTVAGWWVRAILFNALQAGAVYLAGVAWDGWLIEHRPWSLDGLGPTAGDYLCKGRTTGEMSTARFWRSARCCRPRS